jgi:probable F420-dependent oxidoreductase
MTVSLGVAMFMTESSIGPGELAREVEAHGFESLFVPDHTHVPVSRDTPYPFADTLPDAYLHVLEPFTALAVAAASTTKLRIGTGICLTPERDPIVTAKTVATLDVLSDGRFVFGVGFGHFRDELAAHGVNAKDRWAITRERVLAMRLLWTEEVASFDGKFVQLAPSWLWPKPRQQPHPPIFIGAGPSTRTFRHVIEYADGWMPIGDQPGFGFPSDIAANVRTLRNAAEAAGRDPDSIAISIHGGVLDEPHMELYASLHESVRLERVVSYLPLGATRDVVLPLLDQWVHYLD